MKKKLYAILAVIAVIGGIMAYQNRAEVANASRIVLRIVRNNENGVPATVPTISTSTPRYVNNGAASTTLEFAAGNVKRGYVALNITASSAPITFQYEVQYGMAGLIASSPNGTTTPDWFNYLPEATFPNFGWTSSSTAISHASTTPPRWIPITTTATSSYYIKLPDVQAPLMRIRATFLGGNGAVWMSPVLEEEL